MREALRASRVPAVLAMSVLAGVSYSWTFTGSLPFEQEAAWKGLGVGLLAVWAAMNARERDGWLLAAVLALWAAADVALEFAFIGGAALFAAGHATAVLLFLPHARAAPRGRPMRDALLAILPLLPAFALVPTEWRLPVAIYSLFLIAMAVAALRSGVRPIGSLCLTGIGALMFVVSDSLIFARLGMTAVPAWLGYAIWYLYYGGVLLIALSVRTQLDESRYSR